MSRFIQAMRLLEYEMQVGREARVRELSCPVVVVDKVDSAGGGVPDLPARRQRTELLAVHIAQVSEQRHGRPSSTAAILVLYFKTLTGLLGRQR